MNPYVQYFVMNLLMLKQINQQYESMKQDLQKSIALVSNNLCALRNAQALSSIFLTYMFLF